MSELLQQFNPLEFILLVAIIGLFTCILVGIILSYVKTKHRIRMNMELTKEMIQKGLSSEEITRILHPPIQIPNYHPFGYVPFPNSYSGQSTDLKPEIALAKILTGRGLSLESVAIDLRGFSTFNETIQLAILDVIRKLPRNVNLEEELSNLIRCAMEFPTPDPEILTPAFCAEYLATVRFLTDAEKTAVRDLLRSLIHKVDDGVGYCATDLIALLQTVSRKRIDPETKNPETENRFVSPPLKEENRVVNMSPQIELEIR